MCVCMCLRVCERVWVLCGCVCVCVCVCETCCVYLHSQVGHVLSGLDQFFAEVEPEVEGISGEESDTQSFMRLMNIFNKVGGTIPRLVYVCVFCNKLFMRLKLCISGLFVYARQCVHQVVVRKCFGGYDHSNRIANYAALIIIIL